MLVRQHDGTTNTVVAYNGCQKDDTPKLMNLPPGTMTLEIWTSDQSFSPPRVLSAATIVPFTVVPRGSYQDSYQSKTTTKRHKSHLTPETTTVSWCDAAWTISFHRVTVRYLQQLHRDDEMFRSAMERDVGGNGPRLQRLLFQPDLENQWENVVRASMHGRSLPILALLPVRNVVWWRVGGAPSSDESVANAQTSRMLRLLLLLKHVRTLDEERWMHVAEGRELGSSGCVPLSARSFPERDGVVDSRDESDPEDKPQKKNVFLLFGRSWSDLILLREPERAHDVVNRVQRGLPVSVELFVGISPEFDDSSMENVCQTSGMPDLQRMTTIDAGPLWSETFRESVIRKVKLWSSST
jgi:hypothetical protein